jgi:hypothetical protein
MAGSYSGLAAPSDPVYLQVKAWNPGLTQVGYSAVLAVSNPGAPNPPVFPAPVLFNTFQLTYGEPFVVSLTPPDGATGVSPNTIIRAQVQKGELRDVATVQLTVDGLPIAGSPPVLVITKAGALTTITYTPPAPLGGGGHTAQVSWTDTGGGSGNRSWSFRVAYTADPTAVDGTAGSLRQLIITANAIAGPDTILLPAGTYALTISGADEDACATGDLDIMDGLTIQGAGEATAVIDAVALGDRVLDVHTGPVTFSSLTLANGTAPTVGGGGIYNRGFDLTLQGVALRDNTGTRGGGIYLSSANASLVLDHCTFENNNAQDAGGSVYFQTPSIDPSTLSIQDSAFMKTTTLWGGNDGGALYLDGGDVTIERSSFNGHRANRGGAIFSQSGSIAVTASTFHANEVVAYRLISGLPQIVGDASGGAIEANNGSWSLANCTISGNGVTGGDTSARGGGVVHIDGDLILDHCTVAGNTLSGGSSATLEGSAICNRSSSALQVRLRNTPRQQNVWVSSGSGNRPRL